MLWFLGVRVTEGTVSREGMHPSVVAPVPPPQAWAVELSGKQGVDDGNVYSNAHGNIEQQQLLYWAYRHT